MYVDKKLSGVKAVHTLSRLNRMQEIIHVLKDRFGTEFEPADQLLLDSVEADLLNNATIQQQARVNKMDTFK